MGRTKGSGSGSIWKTNTGWRGQITLDGKRHSVSGKTKKEVIDKLADLRVKYNKGEYAKRNDITIREWCDYWITKKVEPNITEQSLIRLRGMFNNHVYPVIGNILLQNIDKQTMEEFYAKVFQQKKGKNYSEHTYSHSTVNALSVQIKKCLQYAVDCGILQKNPHNGVELHKLRPPKKISAYSNADQEKIIAFCRKGSKNHRIFYFLISTGLRFGEAVALTWDDVDLDTGKISITKTAVSIRGSMVIQDRPKTNAGIRTIFVGDNVRTWLQEEYNEQDHDANYRNLVFPNLRMNIMNQANAIKCWGNVCKTIGIEYQGMHSLRHTWATRALEKGVDVKTVSAMLGHKNVITTMNIYQDVLDLQKQKCADTMDMLFGII